MPELEHDNPHQTEAEVQEDDTTPAPDGATPDDGWRYFHVHYTWVSEHVIGSGDIVIRCGGLTSRETVDTWRGFIEENLAKRGHARAGVTICQWQPFESGDGWRT